MTWTEFASLVGVSVTAGIVTALLSKAWDLKYRSRLTVIRHAGLK